MSVLSGGGGGGGMDMMSMMMFQQQQNAYNQQQKMIASQQRQATANAATATQTEVSNDTWGILRQFGASNALASAGGFAPSMSGNLLASPLSSARA